MEEKFFNRELSWLEFNARVLDQGLSETTPLMERIRFLSIVSSNFQEFFQVRLASMKRLQKENPRTRDASRMTPHQVIKKIASRAHEIIKMQNDCLMNDIIGSLAEKNIVYVRAKDFTPDQEEAARGFFEAEILPLLTPLRTDTKKLSHVGNKTEHAAFLLEAIQGIRIKGANANAQKQEHIAVVPIPATVSKLVWLPSNDARKKQFALVDDVIGLYGTQLFPGFSVKEKIFFTLARDADMAVDEDAGENFIREMQSVLAKRDSSFAVALSWCGDENEDTKIIDFLKEKFSLTDDDVYRVKGILQPSFLSELENLDELPTFPAWEHFEKKLDEPFWNLLKTRDILLHVPYESFNPVVKFISDAAEDKQTLAIKMTLYRTGVNSPIIDALEQAARNGKQVTVLVEVKARFDEEQNIEWVRRLEDAGAIVIYGLVNLKVHAKIALVIRREETGIARYVHTATGNYNPKTAKVYADVSLFTAHEDIAHDATVFFNSITGYSSIQKMTALSMAPFSLKEKLLSLIEREIAVAKNGGKAFIAAKMNSLTQEDIIRALYKASNAGVRIKLNVRGVCMLVPKVKNMSERISVVSIVGRYLEHERIFYFHNGGKSEMFISSADWMTRNLEKRVELMCPVLDGDIFRELKKILQTYFQDNQNSYTLLETGIWEKRNISKGEKAVCAQESLYNDCRKRYKKISQMKSQELKIRRNKRNV